MGSAGLSDRGGFLGLLLLEHVLAHDEAGDRRGRLRALLGGGLKVANPRGQLARRHGLCRGIHGAKHKRVAAQEQVPRRGVGRLLLRRRRSVALHKFSKVSALLYFLHNVTVDITFENVCALPSLVGPAAPGGSSASS